jgi:ribonuclease HII
MKKLPIRTASNHLELELLSKGFSKIIGIDEVGRGAFAGPVVVGAFIYTTDTQVIPGVNDSKKISSKKRQSISGLITSNEIILGIGQVEQINAVGIGKTVESLIQKIIKEHSSEDTYFLIDGHFPQVHNNNSLQVLKGDSLHYSISCASVVAKVYRDNLMYDLNSTYPHYNFIKNVGYGTATHIDAIRKYGITPLHRLSFKPIGEIASLQRKIS